ncbi:UDP-N-acetylglucosamine pyrophosphorylase related protein [Desulfurella amilsii]|uniref:UDP-N-acetylglucosamine pyrophosphorylase related protein n=1 Tax=Desulfurella amilsii TaxID=1562698 RepID=A0A1X4XV64_9BACT|nr:phosphocholine cytidylyltransferase family protein [Desulfurella amilsii]OSS41421.1 UDP-N-acetylglucosamine pyrophosphorylase related protein [Desulfurella amilsii]
MKVVVLAAGFGMRLENSIPKTLTKIHNKSILEKQIENITKYISINDIIIVVGFKKEMIMESFPELLFVYNSNFHSTNTAKSLSLALNKINNEDVLWLNADIVFDDAIIADILRFNENCMATNVSNTAQEEVKYILNEKGYISKVSKNLTDAKGEALGINFIKAKDLNLFKTCLQECTNKDYFEEAINKLIQKGIKIAPLDLGVKRCIEIDFLEDLETAKALFSDKEA